MNNPLTQRLLEKASLLQQTSYITLTAIHPTDRQQPVPSRHIPISDTFQFDDAYKRLLIANEQGWGAYVGVGYRRRALQRHQRGGKHDILALPAIFADIDRSPDRVLPRLKTIPEPSLMISSGRGVHLYWFLKTPTTDLSRAEQVLKGMALWLDADTTMTSDQIMRIPSTQNTKRNVNRAMCRVLTESHREYDLDDFLPYLILTTALKPKPSLPRQQQKRHKISYSSSNMLNPALAQAILSELERSYGAVDKGNGWYACYCPFGHKRDRHPGDHAYYRPDKGLLNCFGRHGQHLIHSVASQIGIDVNRYGGIYKSDNAYQ